MSMGLGGAFICQFHDQDSLQGTETFVPPHM